MFDGRATIELAERLATSWLTAIRLILVWHPVYALGQQHEPLERICRQGREYIAMLSGTIQTSYATWPFWQMMQRCLDWCCSFHIPDDRSCEHGSPRLGIQLEGENQIFAPSLGLYSAVMAWTPIPCHVQVPVFPRPGESDDVSTPPSGAQIGRVRPHSLQRLALKHRPIDADVHRPMPLGRPLPSMHMDDPDDPQPGPSGQGRAPRTPTLEGVRVAEQPVSLRRARTPPPPLNVDEDDNDLPPGQPPRPHLRTPPSSPSSSETEIDEELNAQPDPWGTNRSSTPTDNSSASEDEARGSGLPRPLRSATTEPRVTRRSRREARSRSRSRSGDRRWGPSRLRSMPGRRRASRQDTVLVDSSEEEP
ncbi:ORF437 protein [Gallid alphaherpesvirus 3]|nr:ORF437 protein [Gallid alphaherpesvirus 3]AEI00199.1 ORF437 protein [Gallid alphaherpesvirus 3]QEY02249.1 ORF437 protein [Gallid alphaherpesvirus 3]BAA82893.1 ORF 4 [Marek's disease virus serotype 2 MDV2]